MTPSAQAREAALAGGGAPLADILRPARRRRPAGVATPFISVLHVDELGNVDWPGALTHHPATPGLRALPGELVISLLNPAIMRATVVPGRWPDVRCSSEFGVFVSRIDPHAALALVQHPLVRAQLAPLGRGATRSRRRIDERDVLAAVAPAFDDPWVQAKAEEVATNLALMADARLRLWAAYGLDRPCEAADGQDAETCSARSLGPAGTPMTLFGAGHLNG